MYLLMGSTGGKVKQLQETLNYLSVPKTPLQVDGIFGPLTRACVVKFQQTASVKPDGIVGPITARALCWSLFGRCAGRFSPR
jgi:peptidoglycan hydrolase-like protein with peptidoglycan-binding domain